jgi:hypothetical protein
MNFKRNIFKIGFSFLTVIILLLSPNRLFAVWSTSTVDSAGNVGDSTSIDLDSSGYPHISYFDNTNDDLKYAKWTGAVWQIETVDTAGYHIGGHITIALDSSGDPHITYRDYISEDLKYAKRDGASWQIKIVDSADFVGEWTSMALDSSDYPCISYWDGTNSGLKYAKWDGASWQIEIVDSSGFVGEWPSIALDSSGYPHISYHDTTNSALKYAKWDGSSWQIETVDSNGFVGYQNSIALDSSDYPLISYYGNYDLKYAKWDGASWQIETVDSSAGHVGMWPSIALDSSDYPCISYYVEYSALKYAKWDGSSWQIETVDSAGSVGSWTSIALDSSDNPHISYKDNTNHDLKYAKWSGNSKPTDVSVSSVTYNYVELTWAGDGSRYALAKSTDDFKVNIDTFVVFSDNLTTNTTSITNLSSDTTYWFRIWAYNGDGIKTDYITYSTKTLPVSGDISPDAPTSFGGIVNSTYSIKWVWSDNTSYENGYRIQNSSGVNISGNLSPDTTFWIENNLDSNEKYYRYVEVFNGTGTAASGVTTKYTLANTPNNLDSTKQTANSVTLNWAGNGTRYAIERSTDEMNWSYIVTRSDDLSATAYCDKILKVDTTYWFRISAYNGDDIITQPSEVLEVKTLAVVPESIYDFKAFPLNDSKIKLTWEESVSENVSKYRIYHSTDYDNIGYTIIKATVSHPGESWTSPALISGRRYYFVVRTVDEDGNEEQNENIVSAVPETILSEGVRAGIKIPKTGKKVTGNRLMVMAELLSGSPEEVKNIRFEFKSEEDISWQKIPEANSKHPNPDKTHPYFVHWDVSSLSEGKYNIRAKATDKNGDTDSDCGYITIEVDHDDADVDENINSKGEHVRREKFDSRRKNTLEVSDNNEDKVTIVDLPEACIGKNEGKIKIVTNPENRGSKDQLKNDIGEYREIEMEDAELTGEATITIPYNDEDDDNMVDDLNIPENSLRGFYYNEKNKKWKELPGELDTVNNTVKINTTHFTLFSVFGVPPATYSGVKVYPNPYKPSKGHSWVKFDGLTSNTDIKIFTMSGEIVFKIKDIDKGEYLWDATNQAGKDLASGIYICLLSNNVSDKKIVKVAILR